MLSWLFEAESPGFCCSLVWGLVILHTHVHIHTKRPPVVSHISETWLWLLFKSIFYFYSRIQ